MLSNRGIETIHWTAIGAANAKDTAIMHYARQNGYSVLTNDLDFSAILVSTPASSSLVDAANEPGFGKSKGKVISCPDFISATGFALPGCLQNRQWT